MTLTVWSIKSNLNPKVKKRIYSSRHDFFDYEDKNFFQKHTYHIQQDELQHYLEFISYHMHPNEIYDMIIKTDDNRSFRWNRTNGSWDSLI